MLAPPCTLQLDMTSHGPHAGCWQVLGQLLRSPGAHLLQVELVVLEDARHGCEAVPGAVPKENV